jgi:uncharacterized SAM-binding protein YcdF (DUF218 family)
LLVFFSLIILAGLALYAAFVRRGKQFALRDTLQKADAIVVLAGTRGNIKYLDGKIRTAASLYHKNWAPYIICSGAFSVKITDSPIHFTLGELQDAVNTGRIQQKDTASALKNWDKGLGAGYMKQKAIELGIPSDALLIEDQALHTRENAEYVCALLKQRGMREIILVTSPFHQKRTYLTFAKVFQPHGIGILNYYAETGEWHPTTWFFSREHRHLVQSEIERIELYRKKGDLL